MSWLNEFLLENHDNEAPLLYLNDGTTLSVQVWNWLRYHLKLSIIDQTAFYTHVSVNKLSTDAPQSWEPYRTRLGIMGGTFYRYIPIELVHYFIASHGGIDYEKTLGGGNVLVE